LNKASLVLTTASASFGNVSLTDGASFTAIQTNVFVAGGAAV
jgi:hypothetical protein